MIHWGLDADVSRKGRKNVFLVLEGPSVFKELPMSEYLAAFKFHGMNDLRIKWSCITGVTT